MWVQMVVCLCVTPWWTGDLSRAQLRLHPNLQQLGKGSDLLLLKHCGTQNEWKENIMCLKQRKHHLKGEERLCYENDMNMGFIFLNKWAVVISQYAAYAVWSMDNIYFFYNVHLLCYIASYCRGIFCNCTAVIKTWNRNIMSVILLGWG